MAEPSKILVFLKFLYPFSFLGIPIYIYLLLLFFHFLSRLFQILFLVFIFQALKFLLIYLTLSFQQHLIFFWFLILIYPFLLSFQLPVFLILIFSPLLLFLLLISFLLPAIFFFLLFLLESSFLFLLEPFWSHYFFHPSILFFPILVFPSLIFSPIFFSQTPHSWFFILHPSSSFSLHKLDPFHSSSEAYPSSLDFFFQQLVCIWDNTITNRHLPMELLHKLNYFFNNIFKDMSQYEKTLDNYHNIWGLPRLCNSCSGLYSPLVCLKMR